MRWNERVFPLLCRIKIFFHSKGKRIFIGARCRICNPKHIVFRGDAHIMRDTVICPSGNGVVTLGSGVEIGPRCTINCNHAVTIGDNTILAPNVFMTDHNHQYKQIDQPIKFQGMQEESASIVIGNDCWIGTNAVFIGNASVGTHCVVGANTVVNQHFPDYSVIVGNPGRIVKQYDPKTGRWERVETIAGGKL